MTILASEVTARLTKTLHDLDAVRWLIPDQWEAIDDAQKSLLEARPDLFEVTKPVQFLGLGPRQDVPADCFKLFDITYNLDKNMVPLSGITKVDRGIMDRASMNWMAGPSCPHIEHWMQGIRERKIFWAYPPIANDADTGQPGWAEMRYAVRPAKITAGTDVLASPDEMINALYYFAMTRLLEKDEKFAGSPQAEMFLQKYAMVVGAKTASEKEESAISHAKEGTE